MAVLFRGWTDKLPSFYVKPEEKRIIIWSLPLKIPFILAYLLIELYLGYDEDVVTVKDVVMGGLLAVEGEEVLLMVE